MSDSTRSVHADVSGGAGAHDDTDADAAVIDRVIRARHTAKLLLDPAHRAERERDWSAAHAEALRRMIEGAAWAPFHRRANESRHRGGALSSAVPWRFHVVEGQACTSLLGWLERQAQAHPESKWSRAWQSKIKDMLSACGALVQATWLPDPSDAGGAQVDAQVDARADTRADTRGVATATLDERPLLTLGNVEHIAAASAAVQNLLLAAEARGWKSYWSSGGILRDPELFAHLGMGPDEALLGSLFLSPAVPDKAVERAGGLREERGELSGWARWVTL